MAKNFCFTINNYTPEDIEQLEKNEYIKYMIIGKEKGEKGTPHLQGYMQLTDKKRLTWIKKHIHNTAHFEISRGTQQENYKYCSKEGDFKEYGTPTQKGTNTNELYNMIMECSQWTDVLKINGIDRRLNYAREVWQARPPEKMEEITPRKWQKDILDILATPPDGRTIHWVYDKEGGKGKTYLCKYLVSNHNAFYFSPAKSTDILYAYNNQPIVLFDIPRCTDEQYINWGCIEKLKDGIYFNGKFYSGTKYRKDNTHIIIFGNELPPAGKFSKDRIKILDISNKPYNFTFEDDD